MYEIELATAQLESTMATSKAAMLLLLDHPDTGNTHLAKAIKTILDDNVPIMARQMEQMEHTVRQEYQNPADRPVSEANAERVEELIALTHRYEQHMNALVNPLQQFSETSIQFTMLAYPITKARAIEFLNGEALTRDDADEAGQAYRQAMREAASENKMHRDVIEKLQQSNEIQHEPARAMLQQTLDALDTIDRIIPPNDRLMPTPRAEPDVSVKRASPHDSDQIPSTATRFYDSLVRHYRHLEQGYQLNPLQEWSLQRLESTETKRILFDSRQATVFRDLATGPPENVQRLLKTPFDSFYLEPTSPIWLDIGMYEKRILSFRALLVTPLLETPDPDVPMRHPINVFTWITDNDGSTAIIAFAHDLATGCSYIKANVLRNGAADDVLVPSQVPADIDDDSMVLIAPDQDRILGSIEEMIWQSGQLLNWTCCYMMAKSIEVVPELLSRQRRKALARRGLPNPWHVVRVDPKIREPELPPDIQPAEGPRIRFDVIGHLRFGRHRRGDGSYSETIEWVRPHQRGLANELYIPKISRFSSDRNIHPRMEQYWGRPDTSPDGPA